MTYPTTDEVCQVLLADLHPTLQQTILTMMAFHDGQMDKSGVPYFNHPLRVMLRLGEDKIGPMHHAALLHDVIEDCGVTPEILYDLGYGAETVDMVVLLSRPEDMPYRDFIRRLMASGNVGAQRIKLADLYDNCSEVRRERLTPEVRADVEAMIKTRYKPAIGQLRMVLGSLADSVTDEEMEVEIDMKGEDIGQDVPA